MTKRRLFAALACAVFAAGAADMAANPSGTVPGRVIVKFRPEAARQLVELDVEGKGIPAEQLPIGQLRSTCERFGIERLKKLSASPVKEDPTGIGRIYILEGGARLDVAGAVRAFQALTDLVEYAEPDRVVTIQ